MGECTQLARLCIAPYFPVTPPRQAVACEQVGMFQTYAMLCLQAHGAAGRASLDAHGAAILYGVCGAIQHQHPQVSPWPVAAGGCACSYLNPCIHPTTGRWCLAVATRAAVHASRNCGRPPGGF